MRRIATLAVLGAAGGCATSSPGVLNYDHIEPYKDRLSNTAAVQLCERQRPPVQCNDLRYAEIQRYLRYLDATYGTGIVYALAKGTAMSEGFGILMAKSRGVAYDPPGGRPIRVVHVIPPPSRPDANGEFGRALLRAVGEAAGAYVNAAAGAGPSPAHPPAVFTGTGRPGPGCKPREVKPHDSTTCPY